MRSNGTVKHMLGPWSLGSHRVLPLNTSLSPQDGSQPFSPWPLPSICCHPLLQWAQAWGMLGLPCVSFWLSLGQGLGCLWEPASMLRFLHAQGSTRFKSKQTKKRPWQAERKMVKEREKLFFFWRGSTFSFYTGPENYVASLVCKYL